MGTVLLSLINFLLVITDANVISRFDINSFVGKFDDVVITPILQIISCYIKTKFQYKRFIKFSRVVGDLDATDERNIFRLFFNARIILGIRLTFIAIHTYLSLIMHNPTKSRVDEHIFS